MAGRMTLGEEITLSMLRKIEERSLPAIAQQERNYWAVRQAETAGPHRAFCVKAEIAWDTVRAGLGERPAELMHMYVSTLKHYCRAYEREGDFNAPFTVPLPSGPS